MIKDASNSLDITGVNVVNIYNPAFGYASAPLGLQTNILLSYYSTVKESSPFPSTDADNGGLTGEELQALGYIAGTAPTAEELKAMSRDLTLGQIDLGKVYVAVNPSNVDFTGSAATLISTTGKTDGVKLSKLAACKEDLYFGYTRAAGPVYVANAYVTNPDAVDKVDFNSMKEIKDRVKELKEAIKGEGTNATKALKVIYETLNNVIKRKAIQITSKANNTVVSDYEIAATILKPLTFKLVKEASESKYMDKIMEATKPTSGQPGIDKALEVAQKALNDIYASTQPCIAVSSAEGVKMLSASESNPTPVPSNIVLHAVSYCGETLVPFAMKHVAVVAVNGSATDPEVARINAVPHMNYVLNCTGYNDFQIELATLIPGATYSIVYSAMDYAGDVAAVRYYFTVQ